MADGAVLHVCKCGKKTLQRTKEALPTGCMWEGSHLVYGCGSSLHSLLLFMALGSSPCMLPDTLTPNQHLFFFTHDLLLLFPGILEPGLPIRKHTPVYPYNTSPVPRHHSASVPQTADTWVVLVSEPRQLCGWEAGKTSDS